MMSPSQEVLLKKLHDFIHGSDIEYLDEVGATRAMLVDMIDLNQVMLNEGLVERAVIELELAVLAIKDKFLRKVETELTNKRARNEPDSIYFSLNKRGAEYFTAEVGFLIEIRNLTMVEEVGKAVRTLSSGIVLRQPGPLVKFVDYVISNDCKPVRSGKIELKKLSNLIFQTGLYTRENLILKPKGVTIHKDEEAEINAIVEEEVMMSNENYGLFS